MNIMKSMEILMMIPLMIGVRMRMMMAQKKIQEEIKILEKLA